MDDTLPLVDSAMLPDAEKKRLRNSHPLYGRMNGEVIWMAYEELGYDAEACATVMDAELDLRHRTVSLMATLEQSPDACCVLELPDAPCASCTACPIWHGLPSTPRHHSGGSGCPPTPSAAASMPACCRIRKPDRQDVALRKGPPCPGARCSAHA